MNHPRFTPPALIDQAVAFLNRHPLIVALGLLASGVLGLVIGILFGIPVLAEAWG